MNATLQRAAFLDRDGTLIRDANFLSDPALVELLPGVTRALKRLQAAGFTLIVVTNQSGIARGFLTEADYDAVRARLIALLVEHGVRLTGSYHCPHYPEVSGPCDCRKPGTLLHRLAAETYDLDLARSVYIGDRWRDVAPAVEFGGRGFLVPNDGTPPAEIEQARAAAQVVGSLEEAVALVVGELEG